MNFLLDTNIVSEWTKPYPSPRVMQWLAEADEERVFLSVITVAEIQHGIEALPPGAAKRDRLKSWLREDLLARFEGRLFNIDIETALIWGQITALSKSAGRMMGVVDGFIAATAVRQDVVLVTRNVADFEHCGIRLLNPWRD